jgi:hypothetical protein
LRHEYGDDPKKDRTSRLAAAGTHGQKPLWSGVWLLVRSRELKADARASAREQT